MRVRIVQQTDGRFRAHRWRWWWPFWTKALFTESSAEEVEDYEHCYHRRRKPRTAAIVKEFEL